MRKSPSLEISPPMERIFSGSKSFADGRFFCFFLLSLSDAVVRRAPRGRV
jgi:hypothetical protein